MTLLHRSTCLLVALLFLAGKGVAQDYIFKYRYYSVKDGLSSRFLTNVVQDDQGFIWIGSDFGVNRFDGQTFKKFSSNNSPLRSNSRSYLFKDTRGKIWVNNERGQVDIIDPNTERIYKLEDVENKLARKPVHISRFASGDHITGFVNDTLFFDDGKVDLLPDVPRTVNGMKPMETFLTNGGHVFRLYNSYGLVEFDLKGRTLNTYRISDFIVRGVQSTDSVLLFSYGLTENKNAGFLMPKLWSLKNGQPPVQINLTKNGQPFRVDVLDNLWSMSINQDHTGNIWLLIQNELFVFDKNGALITSMPKFEESSRQFSSEFIFIDKDGQAWVNGKMGIYVISLQKNDFRKILHDIDGTEISVRGIHELPDKSLLTCTYNGVYQINPANWAVKKITNFTHYGIAQTKDGTLWLGDHSRKVIRTKLANWSEADKFGAAQLKGGEEYLRPFLDPYDGSIYVGTRRHGLLVFNHSIQDFELSPAQGQGEELNNSEVNYMLFKPDCIWAATSNGLYKKDRQTGAWYRFDKFPQTFIYHFSEDKNNVYWLATRGGGLIRWDYNTGKTEQFNTGAGLSSDIIYAAMDDSLGNLWLPSNYGLMCFEKNTHRVYNYLPSDGITHEEFNSTSYLRGSDGIFYFGSLNGITVVNPALNFNRKRDAALVLTGFKILEGNEYTDGMPSFKESGEIVIKPGQQFFTLDFALQDFIAKQHVYWWQLQGLDENWTVQTENTVRFNALPYGNYVLKLKAESDGGGLSSHELSIPITIVRPFYKTLEFALLAMALLAMCTFYFIQWRVERLRKEKQRLAKLVEERTLELVKKNDELASLNQTKNRLFSIIAHDLRTPLVTLGGLARKVAFLIRQDRMQEVYQLGDSIEDSVASVRNLLDNLLKWSIVQDGRIPHHPEQLNMYELAKEVISLYINVAEAKGVALKLDAVDGTTAFADRNGVSTVIRNLVDNAIKFCPEGGMARLKIENKEQQCVIQVSDTGTGIPPDIKAHVFDIKFKKNAVGSKGEKGNGLGMALSRELVEINSGSISVSNSALGGAVFTVILPTSDALL